MKEESEKFESEMMGIAQWMATLAGIDLDLSEAQTQSITLPGWTYQLHLN